MPRLERLAGVAEVPASAWNALVGEGSPFLEWEWLASLEQAGVVGPGTGWLARPLVLREGDRLLAACPVYEKSHSEGEFVFDFAWAEAARRAGIPYYPKLVVGVPFTPVAGARFLVARGEDRAARTRELAEALRAWCADEGLSGAHVNFCSDEELAPLVETGFAPRIGIQYHWQNPGYGGFADYLAALRAPRRHAVRRERTWLREQGVRVEVLAGAAIPDGLFAALFRCYAETVDAHPFGRRYLNAPFFELLRERFRSRLALVVAWRQGELVAGTLNVRKGKALYGRYWGSLAPLRYLHFEVCYYAAIEWCIAQGIERFEPGAGGEQKFLRGFDARPTLSLHFLTEPRLARAVARALAQERAQAALALRALREQSALRETRAGARSG